MERRRVPVLMSWSAYGWVRMLRARMRVGSALLVLVLATRLVCCLPAGVSLLHSCPVIRFTPPSLSEASFLNPKILVKPPITPLHPHKRLI
ncbi:hypothetical protein ACEPAF_4634 [Sanghuangporus sanghuang]